MLYKQMKVFSEKIHLRSTLQKFPKHFCEDYTQSQISKIHKETKLHEQNPAGMKALKCQLLIMITCVIFSLLNAFLSTMTEEAVTVLIS